MKKILSYIIKYVLPLILGVGIFILLYRQFDTDIILSILQTDMNLFWVACSMLIGLCSFIFRALRWQLQLQALEIKPSFGTICNAVFGTYAFNLILPRFGELWRCTYLANHEKASFSRILGSVVSDRFADMLMVALITATVFLSQISVWNSLLHTYPQIQEKMQALIASPWPYLAIAALVIVVIWLATCKSDNKWISKTRGFLGKICLSFRQLFFCKTEFASDYSRVDIPLLLGRKHDSIRPTAFKKLLFKFSRAHPFGICPFPARDVYNDRTAVLANIVISIFLEWCAAVFARHIYKRHIIPPPAGTATIDSDDYKPANIGGQLPTKL